MYAIVETGGKQYRVAPGDTFRVEKLPVDRGGTVELDRVLMVADGDNLNVGAPLVEGARVVCTVLEQDRAKKIVAFRYRAKKNVRVKRGHRQYFTRLQVDSIEGLPGAPAEEAAAAEIIAKETPAEEVAAEETPVEESAAEEVNNGS